MAYADAYYTEYQSQALLVRWPKDWYLFLRCKMSYSTLLFQWVLSSKWDDNLSTTPFYGVVNFAKRTGHFPGV